jgi:hypothetical protein
MNMNLIASTVGISILAIVAVPVLGMIAALYILVAGAVFTGIFYFSRSYRQKDPIRSQTPVHASACYSAPPEVNDYQELIQALAEEDGWTESRAALLAIPNREGELPFDIMDEEGLKELHLLNTILNQICRREMLSDDFADQTMAALLATGEIPSEHDWGFAVGTAGYHYRGGHLTPMQVMRVIKLQGWGDREMARFVHLAKSDHNSREIELAKMELQHAGNTNWARGSLRPVQSVRSTH